MDHNLDFLKSLTHENTQNFINYNLDSDLFPVTTHHTRITHSSATLIDNIFVESKLTGQITSKILISDISDHLPTFTVLENLLPSCDNKREITSRDIRQKNLDKLNEDLKLSLSTLDTNKDVNSQFDAFHQALQVCIEKNCLITTRRISKHKFRTEPWLTHGLLISGNKQKKIYHIYGLFLDLSKAF